MGLVDSVSPQGRIPHLLNGMSCSVGYPTQARDLMPNTTLDNLQEIVKTAIAALPLDQAFPQAMTAILIKAQTAAVIAASAERAGVKVSPGLFKGLSKAERADVKAAVKGQLEYLNTFMSDRDSLSDAAIRARAAMYAGSVRATFGKARYPGLAQYPGDGQTRCLSNCGCFLTEQDNGIHWNLSSGENCDDCQAMAAGSPYDGGHG